MIRTLENFQGASPGRLTNCVMQLVLHTVLPAGSLLCTSADSVELGSCTMLKPLPISQCTQPSPVEFVLR